MYIRRASICLADISLNNPNVWFELGYALASNKQICLVCSEERTEKYPFDVQHRTITKYRLDSKADFESLQSKIAERLEAIMNKNETLAIIESQSLIKETEGLSQYEMIVLASIVENRLGPGDSVSHWTLKQELERLGYNNIALNIGLEGLLEREMITSAEDQERSGNFETFTVYCTRSEGMKWILQNYERLNLTSEPKNRSRRKVDGFDDIPF